MNTAELYQENLFRMVRDYFNKNNEHINFKDVKYNFRLFDGNVLKD